MRISVLFFLVIFISCKEKEAVYSFEQSPYVEFEDLVFYDSQQGVDTLALSFIVWDREGDLGIGGSDINPPHHYFDLVIDQKDALVTFSGNFNPPFYSIPANIGFNSTTGNDEFYVFPEEKQIFSEVDSRPDFTCDSYYILKETGFELNVYDTLFGSLNSHRNNLHIGFLRSDGSEFDFNEILSLDYCEYSSFDARIPPLEEIGFFDSKKYGAFNIERRDNYSYRITYNMSAIIFKRLFESDQFEVSLTVYDRELNKSDDRSGLVSLQEITD